MTAQDVTAATAGDLADLLGVVPRRIRQLAEEGRLRRRDRGLFDAPHAMLSRAGGLALGQDRARGVSADTLAAVGWLMGFAGRLAAPVTKADLAAWRATCTRWGLSDDESAALLAAGAGLLGDRTPSFER
ncbi:MAG: hypothetical protein O9248_00100 [Rhodobacteraceae bacterium]|nr:hypothetical protein [Paracoccaceae bacterium]